MAIIMVFFHVAAGCDVVLLCWPWRHCSLDDGLLAVLCNLVFVVAFVIVSRGVVPKVGSCPGSLIA
jgi:hypothetical protein